MPDQPVILIHGYSSHGNAFGAWKRILEDNGYRNVHVITWQSLVNEINLPDIAEGFDRALRLNAGLQPEQPFDCMVHSTGMLVIREWLAHVPDRRHRLKRLIALAPATFGSPVARKGRGLMGAIIKGRKELGPDFLDAGVRILDALELASPYTWKLSHIDLFGEQAYYGKNSKTPYVFSFCGDRARFFGRLGGPASDGVVRIAGSSLNTRKITLDFSRRQAGGSEQRIRIEPWTHADSPVVPVRGANHNNIFQKPDDTLVELVLKALQVKTWKAFQDWQAQAATAWWEREEDKPRFQQLVVHAVDERGDGIPDYSIKMLTRENGRFRELTAFDRSVNAYSQDSSYRCFHFDLNQLKPEKLANLWIKVVLASGTHYSAYTGYDDPDGEANWIPTDRGLTEADLELTSLLDRSTPSGRFSLFYPRTTTFLELIFDREPLPLDPEQEAKIAVFEG